jgi:protease I
MTDTSRLAGRKIAFLAINGVQESELTQSWDALVHAGACPELVSLAPGEIQSTAGGAEGRRFRVDQLVTAVSARDYDALVLPTEVADPNALGMDDHAVNFVRGFLAASKPVIGISRGPWMLVTGGAIVPALAEAIAERSLDKMVEQSFPASDPLPSPTAI